MTGQDNNIQTEDDDATIIRPITQKAKNIRQSEETLVIQPEHDSNDVTSILDTDTPQPETEIPLSEKPQTLKQQEHTDRLKQTSQIINEAPKASEVLTIGSILQNRFVINKVLGSGGMGTVFQATDLRRQEAQDHQPDVAIKVLKQEFRQNPELFIALQRETKKSQLLAHPNIVTVYDFDRDGNNVFMVMELLKGRTLTQYIRDEAQLGLPYKKVAHLIRGLSLGLAYAHKKNIIHSDFKPGNIFITTDGSIKILDFGIACAAVNNESHNEESNETVFNARDLGALTPAYASLEMFQGKSPSPADDVYALACVCFELLNGKHPYGKLSAEKAIEVKIDIPSSKGLNRKQRQALNHALALKAGNRTPTVDDFLDGIEPQSILPKILAATAVITLVGAGATYYYMLNEMDVVNKEIIELNEEQKLAVKDFLELAEIHFEVGYLTAPSGSNALWAYRQVLDLDPYNKAAQNGLVKIAEAIKQEAQDLYASGDYKGSLAKIEEGLEAVPKDDDLLGLKDQILQSNLH